MLRFAVVCLLGALGFAFFGFAGMPEYSWEGARILFVIFLAVGGGAFVHRQFTKSPYESVRSGPRREMMAPREQHKRAQGPASSWRS